jgi:hypothetical protein
VRHLSTDRVCWSPRARAQGRPPIEKPPQETTRSSRRLRWVPEAMCLECWVACGHSREYYNHLFFIS